MLGGGGHSKAQEIGQNSEKTIHNDLTYNKLDNNVKSSSIKDIHNANNLKNIYAYNKVSSQNYNVDKQFTINNKTSNAQNITEIGFARECANTKTKANNGGNKMRNQDINNKTTNKIEKTSIGNNSSLFANTINIDNASRKETQVLSRAETLQKRAGHIRTRINRRMSVGAQTTNTLMRSTIQLVLWLFVFVLSTMIVYFTNTNNGFNIHNAIAVDNETVTDAGTDFSDNGGDGTPEDPYKISSADNLRYLSLNQKDYLSSSFILTADITYTCADDVEATARWTPIGTSSSAFTGTFDGNGHAITFTQTVHITSESRDVYGGLFGYVKGVSDTQKAEIKNLGVNWAGKTSVTVNNAQYKGLVVSSSSSAYAGGIAGWAQYSTISNSYNTGAVTATSSSAGAYANAGGIAGRAQYSTISNSYNTGTVTATSSFSSSSGFVYVYAYVGGIAGYTESSTTISNSYNTGTVTATSSFSSSSSGFVSVYAYAGGIAGYAPSSMTISNSYNTGSVTATSSSSGSYANAGGIAGRAQYSTISNSYNTGSVTATSSSSAHAGGIVGYSGTISNCFSIGDTAPSVSTGSHVGGIVGSGGTVNYGYHNYIEFKEDTGTATIYKSDLASLVKDINNFTNADGTSKLTWYDDGADTYDWNFTKDTGTWMMGPSEVVNGVTVGINFGYPIFQWQWNGAEITPSTSLSGSGTQDEPYLIEDAQDLKCLSRTTSYWTGGKYFKQTADITYTDVWSPIGTSSSSAFEGNYDGGGFEIAFTQIITIENTLGDAYGGLFGYAKNGTIENLGVDWETGLNAISSNTTYAGGVAGFVYYYKSYKTIKYCYNKGVINATSNASSGKTYVGGIIGYLHYAGGATIGGSTSTPGGVSPVPPTLTTLTIVKCYNEGMVSVESTGNAYVGGITGFVLNMRINNCYNSGAVSAKSISDTAYAGGILGDSKTGLTEINNCYNIGNVSATLLPTSSSPYAGGINAKYYRMMEVNNCFYLENCVSFVGDGEMNTSGTSLSLVDMQNTSIYIGWDFTNIWGIDTGANTNGGLPYLKWFEEYHITYIVPDESTNKEKTIYYGLKSIVSSFTAQISSIEEIGLTIPSGKEFIHWVDDNGNTYNVGDNKIFTNNKVLTAICLEYISFNITTNVGVIFNICDNENNILQSIYVSAGSSFADNSPTFVYQAQGNQTYKVMISAPYTSNIQHTRVNGQQELVGRVLTLMVGSDKFTVEMDITGYLGGNSIVV